MHTTIMVILATMGWCGAPRLGVDVDLHTTLDAIRARDSMIRALEWEQTITVHDVDGSVVELEREKSGFDDTGQWYCQRKFRSKEESGWVWHPACFRQRGERVQAFGDGPTGLVRPTDSLERSSFPTAESLLGWFLDQYRRRSISETLDEAVRVSSIPSSVAGRRRIAAQVTLNNQPVRLEVEIDPGRDGAITEVSTFDLLLGHPGARRIVTAFERRDGMWIPVEGTVEAFNWAMSEEQAIAFDKAVDRAGLQGKQFDPYDPVIQAKHHDIVCEVFGADGIPTQPLGVGKMRINITKIVSVNLTVNPIARTESAPAGMRFYNTFEDGFEDEDGGNLVPNIRPRPEAPK